MTQVGPALILQDSLMHRDNQIGDFIDDECHLYVGVESVVNGELTLVESQQLAADLPAIRAALRAQGFAIVENGVAVDAVPNLPASYQAMWTAVYA